MLDCGIHPGLSGMDALPFVDMIEADQVRNKGGCLLTPPPETNLRFYKKDYGASLSDFVI